MANRVSGLVLLLAVVQRVALCLRPYNAQSEIFQRRWSATNGRIPIWLWWNYTANTEPGYVVAAQKALERSAPTNKFTIMKVNNTNVKELLPDWPEEASGVYTQAITDLVRSGLLNKYGGVYLDSDMLVAAPMREITDHLDEHDMVSYSVEGQKCSEGTFSCNFMAARPGSWLHGAWYHEAKARLGSQCTGPIGWKEGKDTPACCYTASGEMMEKCHVPWGGLGDRIGHMVGVNLLNGSNPSGYKIFCFTDEQAESFAPCNDCFWTSVPGGHELVDTKCESDGKDGLMCSDNPRGYPKFFQRKVYHLFSSLLGWKKVKAKDISFEELQKGPWVFSDLYRKIMAQI